MGGVHAWNPRLVRKVLPGAYRGGKIPCQQPPPRRSASFASDFHQWWDLRRIKTRAATGNPSAEPFTGLPMPFQHPRWNQGTPSSTRGPPASSGHTSSPKDCSIHLGPDPPDWVPSQPPQTPPLDWSPFLDGRTLRAAKGEELSDTDHFLHDLHSTPRYADFLGNDCAAERATGTLVTIFADDVAVTTPPGHDDPDDGHSRQAKRFEDLSDLDQFLNELHSSPPYADFLGDDYADERSTGTTATISAGDAAVTAPTEHYDSWDGP